MGYEQPKKSGATSVIIQNSTYTYAEDAEASDAYAITLTPAPTAYASGQTFKFKANTANTEGATLNVNGLGAKNILKNNDVALATGDIEAGSIVTVTYDGTSFQMQSSDANLNLDEIADGATNRIFTTTEKSKLSGIADSADVTAVAMSGASAKATPVDADTIPLTDTEDTNAIKKSTFTQIKAFLKTYFDGVYATALGYTAENTANKSTNVVTDGASDTKYPSVKAIKDYADGLVAGLLDYRGAYDASVNTYPASGGSGTAGAIMKGDMFVISVAGTLGGVAIQVGDFVIANVDTPAQTSTNWDTLNTNVSYVPLEATSSAMGAFLNSLTEKTTPVDADMVDLMDSGASNVAKKLSWANIKATAKTYFDTLYFALSNVVDEDNMASNSATKVPTQQSVKAYVDNNAGGITAKAVSATRDASTASGVQNIAHGLGKIPTIVSIKGILQGNSSLSYAFTVYDGTTQSSCHGAGSTNGDGYEGSGDTFRLIREPTTSDYVTGVVTFDATNIIITWTKSGSASGTIYLALEVLG